MHRVLLIRPLEDSLPMATVLTSKGIACSHYPLFQPHYFPIPPLENPQALIITSKNAIRAIAEHEHLKHILLYAVGDKTAALAKQLGFLNVLSASGTSQELIQLIVNAAQRDKGVLWHLSGKTVKEDMVKALSSAGFFAKQQVVYHIVDAKVLPDSLSTELKNQTLSHAIFCSPRTTTVFVNLLKNNNLEKITCQMVSLCLSQEIEKKASVLKWEKLWVNPQPNIKALMEYFDEER